MYVVYILRSVKDNTYYIGYTSDLVKRLEAHNGGKCKYTRRHAPYKVVYTEEHEKILIAKEREKYIKNLKNTRRFLENVRRDA